LVRLSPSVPDLSFTYISRTFLFRVAVVLEVRTEDDLAERRGDEEEERSVEDDGDDDELALLV
jgi:hypothetical protein